MFRILCTQSEHSIRDFSGHQYWQQALKGRDQFPIGGITKDVSSFSEMANCNEVEDMSIDLLKLMNELMSCKAQIENATAEGFMYMAKSRMLLGKERVSMLQIPLNSEEFIPSHFTISRKDGESGFSLIESSFRRCIKFEEEDEKTSVSTNSEVMKLTRRTENLNLKMKSSDELNTSESVSKTSDLAVEKKNDPLNWFGVLVPQELKMAQKAFKKAISLSVDCANIQCKIEAAMEKLRSAKSNLK